MHFKDFDCQFKADGDDSGLKDGEFIAYPSTFTREPDCYGDVVAKGAFRQDDQGMAGQRQYTARVVWASHG